MSEYLIINIIIIAVPLLLTFEKKIQYYKKLKAVFFSTVTVGAMFIVWDIIAAARGDWAFNEKYLTGITVFNLPLEEILFFITVPYSIIFLYETTIYYFRDKQIINYCRLYTAAAFFFAVSSLLYIDQYYTMTVLLFTGLFFVLANIIYPKILQYRLYWYFILFTFIPFFIVDYFLTSIPVVTYNPLAIWGYRVLTIPVEDFFYSFSLLSLYLMFYLKAKEQWLKRKSV